jgi:hypothetical protein
LEGTSVKPTIFVEGPTDVDILRALLPAPILDACDLVLTEGRATIVSVARTHLIRNRAPTAVVLDLDTLEPTIIAETVQTTRHLMASVAGDTSFDIIYCIPHIEAIFFEDPSALRRIFPNFGSVFILPFAKTQPKDQLAALFQNGGGPRDLNGLLGSLTSQEIEQLRSSNPIDQVRSFIARNARIHARTP